MFQWLIRCLLHQTTEEPWWVSKSITSDSPLFTLWFRMAGKWQLTNMVDSVVPSYKYLLNKVTVDSRLSKTCLGSPTHSDFTSLEWFDLSCSTRKSSIAKYFCAFISGFFLGGRSIRRLQITHFTQWYLVRKASRKWLCSKCVYHSQKKTESGPLERK